MIQPTFQPGYSGLFFSFLCFFWGAKVQKTRANLVVLASQPYDDLSTVSTVSTAPCIVSSHTSRTCRIIQSKPDLISRRGLSLESTPDCRIHRIELVIGCICTGLGPQQLTCAVVIYISVPWQCSFWISEIYLYVNVSDLVIVTEFTIFALRRQTTRYVAAQLWVIILLISL